MARLGFIRALAAGLGTTACAAWAAAAASAPIPFQTDAVPDAPSGSRWLLALIVCIAALAVIVAGLRRFGWPLPARKRATRSAEMLNVTHRAHLAHTTQLVTVEYGNRRLLLAVAPTHTTCLRDDAIAEGQAPVPEQPA